MSDHLLGGEGRTYKTCRICLNTESVQQYEAMDADDKSTLSGLLNDLLANWILNTSLKIEFKKVNNK